MSGSQRVSCPHRTRRELQRCKASQILGSSHIGHLGVNWRKQRPPTLDNDDGIADELDEKLETIRVLAESATSEQGTKGFLCQIQVTFASHGRLAQTHW